LPSELGIDKAHWLLDLQTAFMVYTVGYGLLSWLLWRLNAHALRNARALGLDAGECHVTLTEIGMERIRTMAAVLSLSLSLAILALPQAMLAGSGALAPLLASLPMFVYAGMGAVLGRYGGRRRRARMLLQTEAGG
jgi:hypothetical protein